MKNLFITILCFAFIGFTACGDSASTSSDGAATTTASGSSKVNGVEIPSFSDKALTEYAEKYAAYIGKYEKAYAEMKKGNTSALTDLSKEGQELGQLSAKFQQGINEKDAAKFATFMEKITAKLTNIASGK